MTTSIKRNYLEINSIRDLSKKKKPSNNLNVSLINPPDFQLNKFFYKQIGKNHRWIDRLSWDDNQWIQYVNNINVKMSDNKTGDFNHVMEILIDFSLKKDPTTNDSIQITIGE